MSGILGWLQEETPPPPALLNVREGAPLISGLGSGLVGTWTQLLGGARVVYTLRQDGALRIEVWDR